MQKKFDFAKHIIYEDADIISFKVCNPRMVLPHKTSPEVFRSRRLQTEGFTVEDSLSLQ